MLLGFLVRLENAILACENEHEEPLLDEGPKAYDPQHLDHEDQGAVQVSRTHFLLVDGTVCGTDLHKEGVEADDETEHVEQRECQALLDTRRKGGQPYVVPQHGQRAHKDSGRHEV
eukprot:CAMPEP_0170330664 /NCGR_PEP_ID=MMETSP0116_2-20130129/66276_1 /TAXON_ID=400756 /ORGANISM="Durinskia baltica, Strain CSIRO CS-38" /LENGTH=115 /DNA_ID=CAMNT_0010583855 /DNA_START=122 /DNA_END=469 /DNA_ORIENTATION=+